jgi:NAD(P)-dependent dehydrogenase (short-subunit alcohol dehydrogenase family)
MTIIVTGASRGIGAGLVEAYRAAGRDVIGTSRSGENAVDVTDRVSLQAFAARLDGRPVPLLVCNAGVYLDKQDKIGSGYAPEAWAATFAANVTGVFLTIEALLPNIRATRGKIAIISSQMGSSTRAPGGSYIYRASKAAALNLGRNLATDLTDQGIAVGIYHPGWVRTDMGSDAAELSVDEAVEGLVARFDELDLESTGAFLTWDGRVHPY